MITVAFFGLVQANLPAPTVVAPTSNQELQNDYSNGVQATFQWNAVPGAAGYVIEATVTDPNVPQPTKVTFKTSDTTYNTSFNFNNGHFGDKLTVDWKVSAVCPRGVAGAASSSSFFSTCQLYVCGSNFGK